MQTELEELTDAYIDLALDLKDAGEMIMFYGEQLMAARATIALLEQQVKLQGVH